MMQRGRVMGLASRVVGAKGFSTEIFVSKLSFYTTEEELKTIFSPFGAVEEARLVRDNQTGRPKGFGFVKYSSQVEAQKAVKAMDGRVVKISLHGVTATSYYPPLALKNCIRQGILPGGWRDVQKELTDCSTNVNTFARTINGLEKVLWYSSCSKCTPYVTTTQLLHTYDNRKKKVMTMV